jgi:hypothetical protein
MSFTRHPRCVLAAAALVAAGAPLLAQTGPPPSMTHLDPEVIGLACAPSLAFARPMTSLLITGGQDASTRHIFRPGDLLAINGGSDNGIEVGQEYFVRRVLGPRGSRISRETPATVQTTGWVKVYAVEKTMSLVTVSHACDTIETGDYLQPFTVPQPVVAEANAPKPQRENYGHILIGANRRTLFAKDDFFMVDRGSDHGVSVGEKFVVFRDKRKIETMKLPGIKDLPDEITTPEFLYELGEAVVVSVEPETSTLLALTSRGAFLSGDYVALRK